MLALRRHSGLNQFMLVNCRALALYQPWVPRARAHGYWRSRVLPLSCDMYEDRDEAFSRDAVGRGICSLRGVRTIVNRVRACTLWAFVKGAPRTSTRRGEGDKIPLSVMVNPPSPCFRGLLPYHNERETFETRRFLPAAKHEQRGARTTRA